MFNKARSQTPGDAALAARAVEHMLKAYEMGDHRAAKSLAFMMTYDGRLVSRQTSPGLYAHDEQGWLRLLDAMPAAIAEADPADFSSEGEVGVEQLRGLVG